MANNQISSNQIFYCRICGSANCTDLLIKEMMFGLRYPFKYKECQSCGCIQIKEYPLNMEEFYPLEYYSFAETNYGQYKTSGIVQKIKKSALLYNHLVFKDLLKKVGKKTNKPFAFSYTYLNKIKIKPWSSILDIGCGNAAFLAELYHLGFSNLTGIDKFINNDFSLFNKIDIYKKEISELDKTFDLVTLHHVFEHMPNQYEVLNSIHDKLNPNGSLIIRIPIKNEAWNIYRENWVQLDAPRHFYIHTIQSFKLLVEKCGFKLNEIIYDSYGLQFWGSEQYKMDIPLKNDKRSFALNNQTTIFSNEQIEDWDDVSNLFNQDGKGDQAIFYLKKNV